MIPAWVAKYIGLEFEDHGRGPKQFDCWGLVVYVFQQEWGLVLPDFSTTYQTTNDRTGIEDTVHKEAPSWIRTTAPQLGDVVVINVGGRPRHCGLVVATNQMLHIQPVTGSCIDGYQRPKWSSRIEGFYRHPARAINCTSDSHRDGRDDGRDPPAG